MLVTHSLKLGQQAVLTSYASCTLQETSCHIYYGDTGSGTFDYLLSLNESKLFISSIEYRMKMLCVLFLSFFREGWENDLPYLFQSVSLKIAPLRSSDNLYCSKGSTTQANY